MSVNPVTATAAAPAQQFSAFSQGGQSPLASYGGANGLNFNGASGFNGNIQGGLSVLSNATNTNNLNNQLGQQGFEQIQEGLALQNEQLMMQMMQMLMQSMSGVGGGGAGSAAGGSSGGSSPVGSSDGSSGGAGGASGTGSTGSSGSTSGAAPSDPPSGDVKTWIEQAKQILVQDGIPADQLNDDDINIIIQHESSGNPHAQNNTDSNAAAGHPSKGLMQTIDSTFNSYAAPDHKDIWNPVDNIVAGVRYAIKTYGSLDNVPGVKAVHEGKAYVGY